MAQLIQVTIVWDRSDASAETSRAVSTTAHCQRLRNAPHIPPPAGLAPWRDRIVLPAGRNGTFFRTRALKQASDQSDLFGPKVVTDPEMLLDPPLSCVIQQIVKIAFFGRRRHGHAAVTRPGCRKGTRAVAPLCGERTLAASRLWAMYPSRLRNDKCPLKRLSSLEQQRMPSWAAT